MPRARQRRHVICLAAILLAGSGCGNEQRPLQPPPLTELRIGFGLANGQNPLAGVSQVIGNIALEGLLNFSRDGRAQPWLADSVVLADDGLTWRINLRPGVRFHNGSAADAATIRAVLAERLPRIGSAYRDVVDIVAVTETRIDIRLSRRSSLVLEGLGEAIEAPGTRNVGTGPFALVPSSSERTEMQRNPLYYGGDTAIDRISIHPYESVRAAWADMLRGSVDMLYEVGNDALDSLEPSSNTRVFTFPRPYSYLVILNTARPGLEDATVRRALNAAIDRDSLVREGLGGHGQVANGPVPPNHWAKNAAVAAFEYAPTPLAAGRRLTLNVLYSDASQERLALIVKRMLDAVGVSTTLEFVAVDEAFKRVNAGTFDAWLVDVLQGPGFLRQTWFWRTGEQYNWGRYSDAKVDAALDLIRGAPDDDRYRAGVAAYQAAIVNDPPAIFLAWSERARAVSTRFDVPVESGRDILSTLRLWKPVGGAHPTSD